MVNINLRVDTPSTGGGATADSENFAVQLTTIRKPLEENLSSAPALPEPGSEMIGLQRLAVCRLNNSGRVPGMEQEKRVRREIANSNERRRMQSINAGFQSLRALLPRRDGEKMSKASILQQSADMLKTLQAEKALLSQQNVQYRQRLENAGELPVAPSSGGQLSEEKPLARQPGLIAPPKKRRKFEHVTDSSDEGVGMMSDVETTGKESSPGVGGNNQYQQIPLVSSVGTERPIWEMEMLQNELIKLRLALEQERRMRLLLEDQLRAVELSRIQTLGRLPGVPSLMEYGNNLSAASPSLLTTSVTSRPSAAVYSNSPTTVLVQKLVDHQNPGGNSGSFTPMPPSAALLGSAGVAVKPVAVSRQPPFAPGQNSSSSSKQSLNAIVEAIRHLEGDQLFVDVETSAGKHMTVTGLEQIQHTDSGISSPVSERYLNFAPTECAPRGMQVVSSVQ